MGEAHAVTIRLQWHHFLLTAVFSPSCLASWSGSNSSNSSGRWLMNPRRCWQQRIRRIPFCIRTRWDLTDSTSFGVWWWCTARVTTYSSLSHPISAAPYWTDTQCPPGTPRLFWFWWIVSAVRLRSQWVAVSRDWNGLDDRVFDLCPTSQKSTVSLKCFLNQ